MMKSNFCILIDNVRSAQNIGSIFRTSDCLSVDKIYLCGISATPPNKEISKTALGATESVKWEYAIDCIGIIEKLKAENFTICAIEQHQNSINLQDFIVDINKKYAFVLGNEVDGVSKEILEACDLCIEIPQFGKKKSFNVSVAAGIVLWDVISKTIKNKITNQ